MANKVAIKGGGVFFFFHFHFFFGVSKSWKMAFLIETSLVFC